MTIRPTILTSLAIRDTFTQKFSATNVTTAGAATYTAASFATVLITRDCAGLSRSDVTPTATELYNAFGKPEAGQAFTVIIRNTSAGAYTITVGGGTGVTVSGTATIAQNNTKEFMGVFTSPTAVTLYSIGTFVH